MKKIIYSAPVAELEEVGLEFAFLEASTNVTAPELEEGWTIEW